MTRRSRGQRVRGTSNAAASARKHGTPTGGVAAEWLLLCAILLVGLTLRASYLRELVGRPDFDTPLSDASFNDYWARGLATGDWTPPRGESDPKITSTPYFRPPGYPYFLAAVYKLAGPGYLAPRIVQSALGLLNCVLAFWLARALWGRGVGLVAAALMSVYWVFIYFQGELQPPVLLVFLTLIFMHCARLWNARPTHWRRLGTGFVLGLLALVRPNVLLFVPVLAAWAWWTAARRRGRRRVTLPIAELLAGVLLAIAPVTIRNYIVAREFVLISTNAGVNLYIGNNERTSLVTPRIPDVERIAGRAGWNLFAYADIVRGVRRQMKRPLTHAQVSRHFSGRAIEFIRENPLTALSYAVRRAVLFWGPAEVSNNKVIHYEKQASHTLRHIPGFSVILSGFLVGLFVWVLDRKARRRREKPRQAEGRTDTEMPTLILLFILTYSASFVPFLVAGRFRVPLTPYLMLFMAYGLCRLVQFLRAGEGTGAGGAAIMGLGLYLLANRTFIAYEPDLAWWHLDRATAYVRKGVFDQAVREYELALRANPGFPDTYALLGSALAEQGKLDEAAEHYRKAIEINPLFAECRRKLALLLDAQGRLDEAIAEYRAALEVSPRNVEALYNFGRALARRGTLAEAVAAYRKALQIEPSFTEAHVNLGVALQKQGHVDAAIAEFRRALSIDPNKFEAHYNLAGALAAQGKAAEAITHLEAALRIRPNHAAARRALETLRERQKSGPPDASQSNAPSKSRSPGSGHQGRDNERF